MIRSVLASASALLALVLAGCAPAAPAPPVPANDAPADLAAIGAAREAFVKAYSAGDAEAVGRMYTADAVSEPNHQPTLRGREAIVAAQKAMHEHVSLVLALTPEETHTAGATGFDRGVYSVTVTPKAGGPATTVRGRYFVYFVKDADGAWKVARDLDNAAAPMAPATTAAEVAR